MNIYDNYRKARYFTGQKLSNSDYKFQINKENDEPTYLSFHLEFAPKSDLLKYNYNGGMTSFDSMPHPLFQHPSENQNLYSAIEYLENINEPVRAQMLRSFIDMMYDIQDNFQWTYEEISGLDSVIKVNPTEGKRVGKEAKINITCWESIDRKMFHAMTLYRKAAWDDMYQRWMLPPMMRYFTMNIYVTEFREFHKAHDENGPIISVGGEYTAQQYQKNLFKSVVKDVVKSAVDFADPFIKGRGVLSDLKTKPIFLKYMDSMLPVQLIKLEMCEFDMNSFQEETTPNLSVTDVSKMSKFKFSIKPGNVKEIIYNPLFENSYLSDVILGDNTRSHIKTSNADDVTRLDAMNQNMSDIIRRAQGAAGSSRDYDVHQIDKGYYSDDTNDYTGGSHTKNWIERNLKGKLPGKLGAIADNAIDYGTSWSENKINDVVNQLKNRPLYNGMSIDDIRNAIGSNDIHQMISAVKNTVHGYGEIFTPPDVPLFSPDNSEDLTMSILKAYTEAEVSLSESQFQRDIADAITIIDHVGSVDEYYKFIESLKHSNCQIELIDNKPANGITSPLVFEGQPTSKTK